uniref:Uncharacterized protein n=1 Tax=Opuntia streptacantha TaxID=393608 RepID=A0A7C9D2L1_OPUST
MKPTQNLTRQNMLYKRSQVYTLLFAPYQAVVMSLGAYVSAVSASARNKHRSGGLKTAMEYMNGIMYEVHSLSIIVPLEEELNCHSLVFARTPLTLLMWKIWITRADCYVISVSSYYSSDNVWVSGSSFFTV